MRPYRRNGGVIELISARRQPARVINSKELKILGIVQWRPAGRPAGRAGERGSGRASGGAGERAGERASGRAGERAGGRIFFGFGKRRPCEDMYEAALPRPPPSSIPPGSQLATLPSPSLPPAAFWREKIE